MLPNDLEKRFQTIFGGRSSHPLEPGECPDCHGKGVLSVGVAHPRSRPCGFCDGTGIISELKIKARKDGFSFRAWRAQADISLKQAADIMGVSSATLCSMELGRKPFPAALKQAVYDRFVSELSQRD